MRKIAKTVHVISTHLGGGQPLFWIGWIGLTLLAIGSMPLFMTYYVGWALDLCLIVSLSVTGVLGLLLYVIGLVKAIRRQRCLGGSEDLAGSTDLKKQDGVL